MLYTNIPSLIVSVSSCMSIKYTNRRSGKKEAHRNWSMVTPEKAASVTRPTLRFTGPVPADSRQGTPSARNCATQ